MNEESNWQECIETNSSLKITPNKLMVKSLLDTSQGRVEFFNEIIINDKNVNYIFENYYSSLLEILHALLILQGYKVKNHICLGYYLRDMLGRDDIYRIFNDCRFNRNLLIYYGRKMDFETAKTYIDKCRELIKELNIFIANL